MEPLVFIWLLLSSTVYAITVVQPGSQNKFEEDWQYVHNDPGGENWYFAQYSVTSPPPELSSTSQVSSSNSDKVWGWWSRWNSGGSQDPARQIARNFECESYGTAVIELDVYFCIDTAKSVSGQTTIYYRRGAKNVDSQCSGSSGQCSGWTRNDGSNPPGVQCDTQINKKHITDTFDVRGVGDTFSVQISWEANGQSDGQSYHTAAFNNFQLTCTRVPTPGPTLSPTVTTATPSSTPSDNPSKSPSSDPSRSPTHRPTSSPTTHFPTKSPTTPIPSRHPSQSPSENPTRTPTTDPTRNPTPLPTTSTTPQRTRRPTEGRSFGQKWGDAFSGGVDADGDGKSDCTDGWVQCNILVFILLLVMIVLFIIYWVLGAVWYKRRQDNRPLPPHLMGGKNETGNVVEMGSGTGTGTHATANKWKSAWELENEANNANSNVATGDAVYGSGGGGGAGGGGGW